MSEVVEGGLNIVGFCAGIELMSHPIPGTFVAVARKVGKEYDHRFIPEGSYDGS